MTTKAATRKATATKPVATAKPATTKDRTVCAGGVYLADVEKTITCKEPVASASNRLCKKHSGEYKAGTFRMSAKGVVKVRALLDAGVDVRYGHRPKADATAKPKVAKAPSAASTPNTAGVRKPRVVKNSGGDVRTSKPPVPEMHAGPVARVMKASVATA